MHVKKFEARTMKEALEMVKSQLGPDAIILSARDHNKSFGLVGEGSVEITAAVSEETLRRKQYVENRIRDQDKDKLQRSSARVQKEVIQKFVFRHLDQQASRQAQQSGPAYTPAQYRAQAQGQNANIAPASKRQATTTRYIDIDDDASLPAEIPNYANMDNNYQPPMQASAASGGGLETVASSEVRIKGAALEAKQAFENPFGFFKRKVAAPSITESSAETKAATATAIAVTAATAQSVEEVDHLKKEIQTLREVIHSFQKVPQNFVSQSMVNGHNMLSEAAQSSRPTMHPGAELGLSYEMSPVFEKLLQSGMHYEMVAEILLEAQRTMDPVKTRNKSLVEGWVAKHILDTTMVAENNFRENKKNRLQIFMGPAGTGKTTTLIKLASHLLVKERKKIAIISADTFKVGATDQMRIYSQILNVPFALVKTLQDLKLVLEQLKDYQHILIDMPGISLKKIEEITWIKAFLSERDNADVHLVLSALGKNSDLEDVVKRYMVAGFDDMIFTNIEESAQHGPIYSLVRKYRIPLFAFGVGPGVPDDFEFATKERLLDLILKISQWKKKD